MSHSDLSIRDLLTHAALGVTASRIDAAYPPSFWEGVDQYDLLVDKERGILLYCAGMIDGEKANVFSVLSVRFDETISDDIFLHQPPGGTRIVWA